MTLEGHSGAVVPGCSNCQTVVDGISEGDYGLRSSASNAMLLREMGIMMIRKKASIGLALLLCFAGLSPQRQTSAHAAAQAAGQTQAPAAGQTERPTSTPYSGDLSIFEYPDRDKRLQIDRVMDLLGVGQGKVVADIGAGSGWFTVRAAARVGTSGVVYAEDINPKSVDYITQRAVREKLQNVRPVLGLVADTKLPKNSVDAVLILKTYHEFALPIPLMEKLKLSLRPGAKVGIIDRNGNGADHGVMPDVVEREMEQAGFQRIGKYDFTKSDGQDYFLIFAVR
jgi:SAM-dependent methyltransferase